MRTGCEAARESKKSSSFGVTASSGGSERVGREASPSHRKVAPSAVQPGDAVVALDLLLALGAFALEGGKYLSEIMPA